MDGSVAVASLEATKIRSAKDVFSSTTSSVPRRPNRRRSADRPHTHHVSASNGADTSISQHTPAAAPSRAAQTQSLTWAQYFEQIELVFTFSLLGSLLVLYQIPFTRPYAAQIVEIQYINPQTGMAGIGWRDIYTVLLSLVAQVLTRALFVKYILIYIAKHWAGIHKTRAQVRFAEQGWNLIYFACSCTMGTHLLVNSPYYNSTKELWAGWPHYEMSPLFKAYYLIQFGYWIGQMYVINVEERRKDHYQMFTHHIITFLLMLGSYSYYYTRVGHVILLLMDVVDALLSLAKIIKYCGYMRACDYAFALFLVGWISFRHIIYCYVTWSASHEAFQVIENKCYYYPGTNKLIRCFSPQIHWTLVTLLGVLQILTFIWLTIIIRVLAAILKGGPAEDQRSDDEDGDDEEDDQKLSSRKKE